MTLDITVVDGTLEDKSAFVLVIERVGDDYECTPFAKLHGDVTQEKLIQMLHYVADELEAEWAVNELLLLEGK